jgi:hypothetical protein
MNSQYFQLAARAHATEDAYNEAVVALRGNRTKMAQTTLMALAKEAAKAHDALVKFSNQ